MKVTDFIFTVQTLEINRHFLLIDIFYCSEDQCARKAEVLRKTFSAHYLNSPCMVLQKKKKKKLFTFLFDSASM